MQIKHPRGFALVATISILSLATLLALAMLSLASTTSKSSSQSYHMEIAKANARLALAEAISKLQGSLGKDQAVCATASLYETHDDPLTTQDESSFVSNRHWLGVWDTTVEQDERDWPVVGKKGDMSGDAPYSHRAMYSDLRHTSSELSNGAWKQKMRKAWLVSGGSDVDYNAVLSPTQGVAVELVGRGSLGELMEDQVFVRERVVVPVSPVRQDGRLTGHFGFWVSNNNTRAKITQPTTRSLAGSTSQEVFSHPNPGAVITSAGNQPFEEFMAKNEDHFDKMISMKSVELGSSVDREALKQMFHDFTTDAYGMHTNVQYGGFKRDLTPLLFGDKSNLSLSFDAPDSERADHPMKTSDPIIPGERKAVLGPNFDALRSWGLKKYASGLASGKIQAENEFVSTRFRPADGWERGVSDGQSFEGAKWGADAPKIHPVMVESRFHFYFTYTGSRAGNDSNMRTHLLPRVCLWNPYNVDLDVSKMVVLMPNPFSINSGNIAFYLDPEEKKRIRDKWKTEQGTTWDPVTGEMFIDPLHSWVTDRVIFRGNRGGGRDGIFPWSRYLGFELEGTTIKAGECLVFSPKGDRVDEQEGDVIISRYDRTNISKNVLSASSAQGEHHFFHDNGILGVEIPYHERRVQFGPDGLPVLDENGDVTFVPGSHVNGRRRVSIEILNDIDFSKCYKHAPGTNYKDNHVHVLKAVHGPTNVSAETVSKTQNGHFPTLQVINNGNGGTVSSAQQLCSHTTMGWYSDYLQTFKENPSKDALPLYQFGTKLLWMDESMTEANNPPMRVSSWKSDHVAFNYPVIAHGNIRPQIVTRSPAHESANNVYCRSAGSWMQSLRAYSPQDNHDSGLFNNGRFVKNPLGAAGDYPSRGQAPMFDLPDHSFGTLSLASLRHASISPYSWHPTYIIGTSIADLHASPELSSKAVLENPITDAARESSFNYYTAQEGLWGPTTASPNNTISSSHGSLLQLGSKHKTTKLVDGKSLSSDDEILTYDIAFEVNQNLWDQYFLSGMPLSEDSTAFDWNPGDPLFNQAHTFNSTSRAIATDLGDRLADASSGLADGFWNNGYYLQNSVSFNVNSTSVNAWVSYLSGLRDALRATDAGEVGGQGLHVFSRVRKPLDASKTEDLAPQKDSGFSGGRVLTDEEIRTLAHCIVGEVKRRGPFLSLADFVNRRLSDASDPASQMGTLAAAIAKSGLNAPIESYRRPEDNNLIPLPSPLYQTTQNSANSYNHLEWRPDYSRQVNSKAWGIPSHLIQSDILTPLAPILSARGDVFTIRTYGDSLEDGKIMATAYLEAKVIRTSEYVVSVDQEGDPSSENGNRPTDPALRVETSTGIIIQNDLHPDNRKYGRRFMVTQTRWLNQNEI